MHNPLPVIFLMGPTAAGKTQLALQAVQRFPLEIISVDSALIYRGMDIGTGKPDKHTLTTIPHHLIDILNPDQSYSAADFCQDTYKHIEAIQQRGKIPLLVGGTMLYFKALAHGLAELPASSPSKRDALQNLLNEKGLPFMYQRLQAIDPEAAQRIHPHDPQRMLRALEVYEATGKPLSWHFAQQNALDFPFPRIEIAVLPKTRAALHDRIEKRFLSMLNAGFIQEVQTLRENPRLSLECPAMRSVGYRQIWHYLDHEYDHDTLCAKAIAATRQLAKRQITWLNQFPNCQRFDAEDTETFFHWLDRQLTLSI